MSYYSLDWRLCFLHIPKTGGTAIHRALGDVIKDLKAFDDIDAKHRKERDPALANHLPLYHLENLLMCAESDIPLGSHYINPLRTFMVVRNPWARMVSLYFHRLRKLHLKVDGKARNTPEDIRVAKLGFVPWLLSTPNAGDKVLTRKPQCDWGRDTRGDFVVDRVLRQERLVLDWMDLQEDWCLPRRALHRVNVGGGQSLEYRQYYNEAARGHMARYFHKDIERFGYAF